MLSKKSSDEEEGNSEWADAMKNILSLDKPKSKNSFVLSRAEKLDPKLEKDDDDDDEESKLTAQANLKKEWMARGRYKPNPAVEGERERKLRRIAVSGVVQLFNAVGKHQRTSNADSSSTKSPASSSKPFKPLDKKSFLGLLLGKEEMKDEPEEKSEGNSAKDVHNEDEAEAPSVEDEQNTAPQWDVLRNDFMMSTKLKDWDKEIDT